MYRHTQKSSIAPIVLTLTVALLALVGSIMWITLDQSELGIALLLPLAFAMAGVVLIASMFWSMTVIVDDVNVEIRFGPGLIRKRFALCEIAETRPVTNSWMYGWGIHWFPGVGWVYNIAGFEAVEIVLKNGKRKRIGTDEPQKLYEAIQQRLSESVAA